MKTTCRCGATWTGHRIEHCSAAGCHQTFTGTVSGDRHRVGDHAVLTGPDRRRCLTVEEMLEKGMRRNEWGYWTVSPPSTDAQIAKLKVDGRPRAAERSAEVSHSDPSNLRAPEIGRAER